MLLLGGCSYESPAVRATRIISVAKPPGVPIVRVKLGDDAASLSISVGGPYKIADGGRPAFGGPSLPWSEVRIDGNRLAMGGAVLASGEADVVPERDGTVRVRQVLGDVCRERGYRGTVRIVLTHDRQLRVINVVNLEAYLAGVVANEMPASWNLEALKAQAVAARTFALGEHNLHTKHDFELYDSTLSQAYGGLDAEADKSRRAAADTWGVVGSFRDAKGKTVLLPMYYHSTCGGMTEASGAVFGGETPGPLQGGVECTYCYRSKKFQWSGVTLTKREISDALRQSDDADLARLAPVSRVEVGEETPRGRVAWVKIVSTRGNALLVRGDKFRLLVGPTRVTSNWFSVKDAGHSVVFEGRGNGHGVGLCQFGAEYLAEHGKTAEEIIRFYYPGVELSKAY
jgi:stage II sporulation protein D